ncbi:MAG TPA: ABC transporter ATP-binding protein [Verrucomicrobiae bacterium]|nr:ABC transporter ATP-binding protein [Verrucomicrobiae bacterium]
MAEGGLLLKLANVTKQYESPDAATPIPILRGVDLVLGAGESAAIIGPSGSGKSTLLQIIGTLDRPTGGEVLLDGEDLNRMSQEELAVVRNRKIGFVFQFHYLLPQCSVLENVLVPTLARDVAPAGNAGETEENRARRLLDRVGLGHRLGHRPGQLSGGERQRAAVVRALINRPRLLLADEPTGSLDHASAQDLAGLLTELNAEEKVALILVTHSRELAARMTRVFLLREGRLEQDRSGPVRA